MKHEETLTETMRMKHRLRPLEGFGLKTKLDVLHPSYGRPDLKCWTTHRSLKPRTYVNLPFKPLLQVST